ncbi:MAG: DUF4315 family protein [Lachnospiraceae bacterium]|nr:DUF4315 family protein [Lachnospiraceae bacterium]MCC8103112.1 DUF4315 family protein [Clostridiales bacterium]
MSAKLKKLGAEVEKARAKWQEWETRTKELEARYREQEDTEICDVTRTYRLAPDELAKLLSMVKNNLPETAPIQEAFNHSGTETEDNGYEE